MLNGMVQKDGMHRLPHRIVAPKGETDITHPPTDLRPREVLLDPLGSLKKVNGIGFMFVHARGNRKDIRVKNDVVFIEPYLLGQRIRTSFVHLSTVLVCFARS